MHGHHFISYSRARSLESVLQLCQALETGQAPYRMWLDRRELRPGEGLGPAGCRRHRQQPVADVSDDDRQRRRPICLQTGVDARQADVEPPFLLANLQYIDFADDFQAGLRACAATWSGLHRPRGCCTPCRTGWRMQSAICAVTRTPCTRAYSGRNHRAAQADLGATASHRRSAGRRRAAL
jgi:hypothetical protein